MSTEGRPRRSAAASNKAWAPLMSKGTHDGEEDFSDEVAMDNQKGGVKRSFSNQQVSTPANARGRKKRSKLSESGDTDSEHPTQELPMITPPVTSPSLEIKKEIKKESPRSPKKLPPTPKITKLPLVHPVTLPHGDGNVEMAHLDFDRHQADLDEKMDEGDFEEEELVPADRTSIKVPPKPRGRPSTKERPPPSLTGMDDPNDADYTMEDDSRSPAKKRPTPKPRVIPQISPMQRPQIVVRNPTSRPATIVVRQAMPSRVVYPNRFPTVVNGGPRVVQPRYVPQPQRIINPAALRQPLSNNVYETPANIVKSIKELTEDVKKVSSPEVVSAFELVDLLRDEIERMSSHMADTNKYYKSFIEDVQAAAHSQYENSQNRILTLEQRVASLESQLKKCSAVAHQKLLKTAVEGFRTNVSEQQPDIPSQKIVSQHPYLGEPSSMEQHMQPRDYLVQEEDYQVTHPGGYYSHESAIQEASKELDNMM